MTKQKMLSYGLGLMEVAYLAAVFVWKIPFLFLFVIPMAYTILFIIKHRNRW